MSDLLPTPLHAMHLQAGAKMVPFAGYDMPVQYPSGIKSEHLHTRSAAGLFDVSHMGQGLFEGADVRQVLEKLLPLDLEELPLNHSVYTFLPNAEGGIIDDLIVTRWGPEAYFVVFNAACKAGDIAHFRAHLSATTRLQVLDDRALLALQGPQAEAVLSRLAPAVKALVFMTGCRVSIDGADCYVTRSGYTGEDGFEISVPAAAAPGLAQTLLNDPAVNWVGLGARDSLRLEAGLCLYGHDMDAQRSPVEAGLMWSVAKSRRADGARAGNFIGADKIFACQAQGAREKRVGLRVNGKAPVREGAEIVDAAGELIGRVTSGGFAPSLAAPIAMGYVQAEHAAPGSSVAAMVRGKPLAMTVCKTPFVPQRYHRG
ncbi:MAG: glycine cleavage system aminomethyltransferase GcvT [Gammaproteobacteria bacterium]|nr:glycine cleavage system aminomethyltransferase GcvT [Gammaproteobacteria bacterium]